MTWDWRKWGLGLSLEFRDPFRARFWLGPLRFGFNYGHLWEQQP